MKRLSKIQPLACLVIGLMVGFTSRIASSQDVSTRNDPVPNPNVVVLRSEKRVTLNNPSMTLRELTAELSRQTGYGFTLSEEYSEGKATYAFLVSNVPLKEMLSATAYLLSATWDRKGLSYHLRAATPEELAGDVARFESDVSRASEYLAGLDPSDPSLNKTERIDLQNFHKALAFGKTYPWSPDNSRVQGVTIRDGVLYISFLDQNGVPRQNGLGWKWHRKPENEVKGEVRS